MSFLVPVVFIYILILQEKQFRVLENFPISFAIYSFQGTQIIRSIGFSQVFEICVSIVFKEWDLKNGKNSISQQQSQRGETAYRLRRALIIRP